MVFEYKNPLVSKDSLVKSTYIDLSCYQLLFSLPNFIHILWTDHKMAHIKGPAVGEGVGVADGWSDITLSICLILALDSHSELCRLG